MKTFFKAVVDISAAKNINEFNKNIIDPIKMTFSYFATGENKENIISAEVTRQQDKTINNFIGYFHQNIFNYIEVWKTPMFGLILSMKKDIYMQK